MVQLAQGLAEVGLLVASIKGWCCLLLALSCIELFPNGSSAMCPFMHSHGRAVYQQSAGH